MSLGQIIRDRREELRFTLDEVAARTGFSKPYLSTVETGKVNNPPSDTLLRKLEKVLKFKAGTLRRMAHIERMPTDIRRDYEATNAENQRFRQIMRRIITRKAGTANQVSKLLAKDKLNVEPLKRKLTVGALVPIINRVSAGYPVDFDDLDYPVGFADDYVRCPGLHDPNAFAVRVVGDSMEPKFGKGDIVILSPAADVQNGDDCFVRFSEPHETTFKRIFFESGDRVRLQPRNENYPPLIVEGGRINGMYRAVIRYETL